MEQPDNKNRILKDGLGKSRVAFKPPSGYFEKLEENISLRIHPPQKEPTTTWIWQPAWALLLSVCILTATFRFQQAGLLNPEDSTINQNISLEEEEITTELLIESGFIMELEDHLLCEAISISSAQENFGGTEPADLEAISDYLMDNSHYSELPIQNNQTQE